MTPESFRGESPESADGRDDRAAHPIAKSSAAQDRPKGGWCETHGGYTGERCGGFQYDGVRCQPSAATVALHVIPVPQGWSAEQAWESIKRGDLLTDPCPDWSIVRTEDGRMVGLVELDDA